MNILKCKYEAHRFVNVIFYFVVFAIGFVLGFGANKIDIKNLLSEFLMIDNVSALTEVKSGTITLPSNLKVSKSNFNSETYIYNLFNYVVDEVGLDISFNDFFNVFGFNYQPKYEPTANTRYYFSNSDWYSYSFNNYNQYSRTKGDVLYLEYVSTSSFKYHYYTNDDNSDYTTFGGGDSYYVFSTHDFSSSNRYIKLLDFSEFIVQFNYDDSIFTEDPNKNFYKYCWDFNYNTLFAVIPNKELYDSVASSEDNEHTIGGGFYGFGDLSSIQRGTYVSPVIGKNQSIVDMMFGKKFENLQDIVEKTDNLKTDGELQARYTGVGLSPNITSGTPLSVIDTANSNTYFNDNLQKLKYAYYFNYFYYFDVLGNKKYNIFKYEPTCEYKKVADYKVGVTCANQNGAKTYEFTTKTNDILSMKTEAISQLISSDISSNICIYVPKDYKVSVLKENHDLGGIEGSVELPDGSLESFFSTIDDEKDSSSLVSKVGKFIDKISGSLEFIKTQVYNFYCSMPSLVQMFILSVLTILIVGVIIGMVVR